MSLLHARGPVRIDANLTPLIDLAFLLIVFFVLIARMSGEQLPAVALPQPHHAALSPIQSGQRIAVNVTREGDRTVLSLGAQRFAADRAGESALSQALAQRIARDRTIPVDVRADRTLHYSDVQPVLRAVANAASSAGVGPITVRVCALESTPAPAAARAHE